MKYAVRYYTKTGNTKKLAEAVAGALGVEALPIGVPIEEDLKAAAAFAKALTA